MANELRFLAAKALRGAYTAAGTLVGELVDGTTVQLLLSQWADAQNIVLGTTTGSKIGTAAGQKLAFWGATPVVRPVDAKDVATGLSDIGLRVAGTAMPGRKGVGLPTAAKALATTDAEVQLCSTASGAYQITLPNTALTGQTFVIKRYTGANNLTVAVTSGTIDGAASVVLTAINQYVEVVYSGAAGLWFITARG